MRFAKYTLMRELVKVIRQFVPDIVSVEIVLRVRRKRLHYEEVESGVTTLKIISFN